MRPITELTQVAHVKAKKAMRWAVLQNEEVLVEVFKSQKHHFYRFKSRDIDDDLLRLSVAAFIVSAVEIHESYLQRSSKNRTGDLRQTKQSSRVRAKVLKKQKTSLKLEKLLLKKSLLLQLIESEGLSYRKVSEYLKRYHHFKVSHTLIREVYKKIKGNSNV